MPFQKSNSTVSLSASSTSSRVAIPNLNITGGGAVRVVCPTGTGLDFLYVAFGDSGVVATTADTPMLPNSVAHFEVGQGATHIAVITGAGTATVKATPGLGSD